MLHPLSATRVVARYACALFALLCISMFIRPVRASQLDIPGPVGSSGFGTAVVVLPNGNIVVTDPTSNVSASNAGSVYLYSPTGAMISTLNGASANDQIGSGGVLLLTNGNYVISSPLWNNGAGAATWGDKSVGVAGLVSASNSLVGGTPGAPGNPGDTVGSFGLTALSNGNYVVASPSWHNSSHVSVGAATWGSGSGGVTGLVSPANSLVGTLQGDQIGYSVAALSNGNYVAYSQYWNNGAGAVTWGNGGTGISGTVSIANSLIGAPGDLIGQAGNVPGASGVTALSNANYVVASPDWHNAAAASVGAVTWGNGNVGTSGHVSATNSLVGATDGDDIGFSGVTALSNGNYVVASPFWHNGASQAVGAATWANGNTGLSGTVSGSNSLVGTTNNDQVGYYGVTAMTNGNYVVASPFWSNGAISQVGAVTWGYGSGGVTGVISTVNSLVGSNANDHVGLRVTALANGNYVVQSPDWMNGVTDAGAATWGNGSSGISGVVSSGNSLVGTTIYDEVGTFVTALGNGNYVVESPHWTSNATSVGAATWGDGSSGIFGPVSVSNSLVGTATSDSVGYIAARFTTGVTALGNGNYAVGSPNWQSGAGATTWGNGNSGISGAVSVTNSLVGMAGDYIAYSGVTALSDGNYVVNSPERSNGALTHAGAITLLFGTSPFSGTVSASNSVLGTVTDGGPSMVFAYDATRTQLVVGRPASNIVTLLNADQIFKNGFE